MKKWIGLLFALAVLPCLAVAQPSISGVTGNFDHGDTIIITGSGFGTKDPAEPWLWENFDDGVDGAKVDFDDPVVGSWTHISYGGPTVGYNVYYLDDDPYSGNMAAVETVNVGATFSERGLQTNWVTGDAGGAARYGFASFKFKAIYSNGGYDVGGPSGTHGALKLLRMMSHKNYSNCDNVHPYGLPNVYYAELGEAASWRAATNIPSMRGQQISAHAATVEHMGEWLGVSLWVDCGTPYNADGAAGSEFCGDVTNTGTIQMQYDESPFTNCDPQPEGVRNALFCPSMSLHDNSWIRVHWDDCYADSTQARVVIVDGNTIGSGTAHNMQLPILWADDSISVIVNTGRFEEESDAWLYVFDRDGDISNAYQFEVGGSGVQAPDDPPELAAPCDSVRAWSAGG